MLILTLEETEKLIVRFGQLRPESKALWGKMNSRQMVRHLLDSMELAMGERSASEQSNWVARNLLKHLAFRLPIQWPKNYVTRPEIDQHIGGTPPGKFEDDLTQLKAVLRRFGRSPKDFCFGRHPVFMELTEWEWMRWSWLHADHHLRQFGV